MNKSKTGRRKQYTMRLNVAAELIGAYVKLSKDDKDTAEGFLALQIYGEEGTYPHRPFPEVPWELEVPSSSDGCLILCWAKAWYDWAQVIHESLHFGSERGEAMKEMLGALIRLKDRRRRLNNQELRGAAETTLRWTRWDAKHLNARIEKSWKISGQREGCQEYQTQNSQSETSLTPDEWGCRYRPNRAS